MKTANSLKADNYRKSGSHATCCRACEYFVDNGPYRRLCRIHQLGPASAYSGAVTPDVRIGCAAAFTARGDFGDDHARCPVAPMIHQLSYPGLDIVAARNRREREGETPTGKGVGR